MNRHREPEDYFCTMVLTIIVIMILILTFLVFGGKVEASEISLDALAMVESSNNHMAVSFLGAKYGRGLHQISEIALKDYNTMTGNSVQKEELFDKEVNKEIALWLLNKRIPQLLRHYGQEITTESVLQAYNLGCMAYRNGKRNKNYVNKYNKYMEG